MSETARYDVTIYNQTSKDSGAKKLNRLGGRLLALRYRMLIPAYKTCLDELSVEDCFFSIHFRRAEVIF